MILAKVTDKNSLGEALEIHGCEPMTGFYRDGYCRTGADDKGSHVIAAVMTQAFLDFTKSRGNDLQTPQPNYDFPGLEPGDRWCLCAVRWHEAYIAGVAPPIVLKATHEKALTYVALETLKTYQLKA
jgi:uncharacterized protein